MDIDRKSEPLFSHSKAALILLENFMFEPALTLNLSQISIPTLYLLVVHKSCGRISFEAFECDDGSIFPLKVFVL